MNEIRAIPSDDQKIKATCVVTIREPGKPVQTMAFEVDSISVQMMDHNIHGYDHIPWRTEIEKTKSQITVTGMSPTMTFA